MVCASIENKCFKSQRVVILKLSHIFVYDCNLQMTRFGIDFDYKIANQLTWRYPAAVILTSLLVVATAIHSLCQKFEISRENVVFVLPIFGLALFHNSIIAVPLLTYIHLMRTLQKRYAELNKLLK